MAVDPDRIEDIRRALATTLGAVDGVQAAEPYERRQAADMPLVTVMSDGFARAGVETPNVQGSTQIQDPIGGRAWLWRFWVRLFVSLKTDEVQAQQDTDRLTYQLVVAVEENPTLGITPPVEDVALTTGDIGIIRDQGNAQMINEMTCEVTWVEAA